MPSLITIKKALKLQKSILAVLVFALILNTFGIFLSANAAPATDYKWVDRQTISVSGGSVAADQKITVDPNSPDPLTVTRGATITVTETGTKRDCTLWIFCKDVNVDYLCYVPIGLQFTNSNSAKVTAVKSTGAVYSDPNAPQECYNDSTFAEYNNTVISIKGTRPGDATTTAETHDQKYVNIAVKSTQSVADAPKSVNVKITRLSYAPTVVTSEYQTSYGGDVKYTVNAYLEPGSYTACVTDLPSLGTNNCTTFTKEKFKPIYVAIGSGAEGYGSRQIQVTIDMKFTGGVGSSIPAYDVYLYDKDGKEVDSLKTNVIENTGQVCDSWSGCQTATSSEYFNYVNFNDVDPGTYSVCLGTDKALCNGNVVKVVNVQKAITFEITGSVLSDFITKYATAKGTVSTCAVDGVGWIVCPIINFMTAVNDTSYKLISNLLVTDTSTVSTSGNTYTAWQTMRNFANVGFVIFFLVIIFSQITSIGISNYGLKKLFPRLVVAAILVNVSFFVCQIAVDLSNVSGGSLKSLFDSILAYKDSGALASTSNFAADVLVVGGGTVAVAGVAAVAITAGVGAGILLPVLFAALLSVLLTLAILAGRQVMVILLTVISPLALLAMLLPNTQSLYKQWRKIFVSMLTVYPMIAVLFGASNFAASIIVTSNPGFLGTIMGILVTFVPLALTPKLLQGSLKAVPMLGDMASKLASKSNASFGNAAKPIIANQKAKSAAGKDMFNRDRKPAKFLKSIRNRRAVEYEKHAENGIGADGKEYKKGDNVLDASGNKIVAKNDKGKPIYTGESERRRSWTQVSGDATRNIEAMTKGNQAKTETDWANRGLTGATKAGRNTRDLLDGAQVGAMDKQAVDEQYKARLEVNKLTNPGARDIYDRLSDAQRTTAGLSEEQKKRQFTRLQNDFANTTSSNIGLDRLSTLSNMSAEEQTELGITHDQAERFSELSDINNPEGGGLKVLHHSEDAAKQEISEIESGFKAELSERKTEGGDLHISAVNEAKNTKLAKGADDELGATVAEYTTTKSEQELIDTKFPELDASNKEKFPLGEKDPAYIEANDERKAKIAQFKQLTADGNVRSGLQDAAETIKAAGERTRYAEGTSTIDLDQKILDDEAYARRVSGIAPTTARARSKAYDRVVEDNRGDVKVTESEFEQSELSAQETLSLSGINAKGGKMFDSKGKFIDDPEGENLKSWDSYVSARAKIKMPAAAREEPQTALDLVQQEALVRRTIKAQDEGDNMRLTNYLEQVKIESDKAEQDAIAAEAIANGAPGDEAAATSAKDARESAKKARERSLTLSRAAAEQYSSNSKGLSPFLSTARREKLSHGDLDVTTDESVVETLGAGKMSARFVAGWNINHFVQAEKTLTDPNIVENIKKSMDKFAAEKALSENPGKDMKDSKYKEAYEKSIKEQKDSIANSRKALDEAQDGPFDVDERSVKRIEKMREALLKLENAGVISKPKPLPGMTEYKRVERDPSGEIRRDKVTDEPILYVAREAPAANTEAATPDSTNNP